MLTSSVAARTALLLQGPPTLYFNSLQNALEGRGIRCVRVNLSGGDWLRSRGRGTRNYRGSPEAWETYVQQLMLSERVTDVIYYADRLPYHRIAKRVARRLGVVAHAIEFGYLRPNWLTLERGGQGGFSHLPSDPDAIRRVAARLPPTLPDLELRYSHTFAAEAYYDVTYNLATLLGRPFFARRACDRTYHPLREYLAWLPQLFTRGRRRKQTAATVERLKRDARDYFVFPLQLQSDYQIRANSPFGHLSEAIEQVVASFARNAPATATLLVKVHPLDSGIERWPSVVRRIARAHGIEDRVEIVSIGPIDATIEGAKGVVLINSTVGLATLKLGLPLIALGVAVFDVPGLTFQGSLDAFWTEGAPPDPDLRDDFFRVLTQTAQVKGSFYDPEGRRVAASAMAERIVAGEVNGFGAYVDPPPRIPRACALGIPVDADEAQPAAAAVSAAWYACESAGAETSVEHLPRGFGLAV